jgi:hypothetical protein
MTYTETFGALSILMMLLSRGNYFLAIFRGGTRPHAFSWLIWTLLSGIGTAAQIAEGAGPGFWARAFASVTNVVIVGIAFRKGTRNITRADWITLLVALCTIPLWIATKTPVWSVLLICLIDTLGYFPTARKSWTKPYEEAARSYSFSACSAIFSLLAIEHYNVSTWLYPAELAVTNLCMVGYLLWRRRHLHGKPG